LLTNAKGAFSESLAEFALFGIMYFAKRLPHTLSIYGQRKWEKFTPIMVRGATLGIVGYGDIGEKIARLAKVGFGMRVLAVKRRPETVTAEARQWVDGVWSTDDVNEVLAQCDYVVSVLPGTPATHHFFDEARFKVMKDTAVVLNLGRGSAISTLAIIAALKNGDIAGAVLDVQVVHIHTHTHKQIHTPTRAQPYPHSYVHINTQLGICTLVRTGIQ
jgi:phosphoglycerate dehydrogenase-like enzyme